MYFINSPSMVKEDDKIPLKDIVKLLNNRLSHLPIDSNTTNVVIMDCMKYGELSFNYFGF